MLLYLLNKEPEDRIRKDHQAIEDQLVTLRYFDQLHSSTKSKLYRELLKAMAQNAKLNNFTQGQLIWKFNDRQDKIMILCQGQVQEYKELQQQEMDEKRKQLMKDFKSDIFIERPGRKVTFNYQQNGNLTLSINDQPRLRRTQVCELPQKIELKRTNSIRNNRCPQIPPQYTQSLNNELQILLKGIKLQNELFLQYFLCQTIVCTKQTKLLEEGDILNSDLNLKKQETTLLALSDCVIIQMNLSDYQNVENQIKIQKQSKIYRLLEAGFVSEQVELENELHQVVKTLMSKYVKFKFNPNNTVYQKGQQFTYIYVLIYGECQLNDESNALIRVNQGCLLGEESFDSNVYQYKCVTTTKCKMFGVKIQDIQLLCQRYYWLKQQLVNKKQIKSIWLQRRQIEQRKRIESTRISLKTPERCIKTHRPTRSQNIFDQNQYQELMSFRCQYRNYNSKQKIYSKQQKQPQSQPSFSKDFSTDMDLVPMLMSLDKQQSNYLKELLKKGKLKQSIKSPEQRNWLKGIPESTQKIMKRIQQQMG